MNITVLNTSFIALGLLDNYQIDSILWIERYNRAGEFEIYGNFSFELLDLLKKDYYLVNSDSDYVMIVESVAIKTDPELGNKITVKGRSLESILDRRIVLRQIVIDSSLQSGIETILNKEIINGIFPERNYGNFVFSTSVDPLVTTPTLESQYYMDNVYDVISTLCFENGLGFKIILNSSNQFVFSLYAGVDRSFNQSTNPFVKFSPEFDNLMNSEYFTSKRYYKNYIFVSGEEGLISWNQNYYGRWGQAWTPEVGAGMLRYEMFLDANTLLKTLSNASEIPDAEYSEQLKQRGFQELSKYQDIVLFDGQIDVNTTYKYREDFFLGDIVQLVDSFGHASAVRITEMTMSRNTSNGYKVYPTLETY